MKVGLVSLGCPKNLVDSEIMLGLMKNGGFDFEVDLSKSDVIVVNTCGFIDDAKIESTNKILEVAKHKEEGKCKALIVTGCLAERYSDGILTSIPEVDAVLGTAAYGDIVETIKSILTNKNHHISIIKPQTDISWLENDRILSSSNGSAYLKISEGCDNKCTYCIIPSLRGPFRSRDIKSIIAEASKLALSGIKEVILVGQDTTRYGIDLYSKPALVELIGGISDIEGIEWIRLLYCYPEMVSDELINEIATNDKVCKYIDVPIQHSSDRILKKMGRRTNTIELVDLIKRLREANPLICIRSTFIVGFPGETAEDFQNLKAFISDSKLDYVGVFCYSQEEGTPAATFDGQIPGKTAKSRQKQLMKVQNVISATKLENRVGKSYKVLVDNVSDDGIFYFGRSQFEAPEIDGQIYFTSKWPLKSGDMVNVQILNSEDYDLIGDVKNEPAK
ncbi:MAG: 30S ribosomal protein S12 methylthiotransferase RimO [Bacillota bacterium]